MGLPFILIGPEDTARSRVAIINARSLGQNTLKYDSPE
jgi:hypothetical protein